jgi:type III restriction enzyme
MRHTLDTVGKLKWPTDSQGRPIYPEGFEPLHPPGRDIRCIVSVGMLTEGWDANTVTHIIGIRPFMSQLLCEQVVGRGLRRASYELDESTGRFREEVAQVLGVPFEVVPFKATRGALRPPPVKRFHVHSLPERAHLEIRFPRVEGYTQAIRHRIKVDWDRVPPIRLDPLRIPPEAETRGLSFNTEGRPTISGPGPGRVSELTLQKYRGTSQTVFSMA